MAEENEISEEEILAFLNNEIADGSRADVIAAYLEAYPHILDKYLDVDPGSLEPVPGFEEVRAQLKHAVITATRPRASLRWLAKFAAAASVIIFLGLSFFYFAKSDKPVSTGVAKISIVNRSGKDSTLLLDDGSVVILSTASEITISDDFRSNRNVVLVGDALFKVAKDKLHPFVVDANGVKTQALGTEFWVRTKKAGLLSVALLEGKVRISGYSTRSNTRETYLDAGQQFIYSYQSATANVSRIAHDPVVVKRMNNPTGLTEHEISKPASAGPASNKWTNNYFQTSRATLTQLFKKIEHQHGVVIVYRNEDIENIRFTGKIMYKDKPETILEMLCKLNNLTYTMKNDSIFIKSLNKSFEDEEPVH